MYNNLPIIEQQQINNQIQQITSPLNFRYNHRSNLTTNFEEKQIMELKRYLQNDLFAAKASFFSSTNFGWAPHFQINNKDNIPLGLTTAAAAKWIDMILTPQNNKNLKFKQLRTLSLVSNQRVDGIEKLRLLSQMALEHKTVFEQYNITDQGILFRTPKIITNILSATEKQVEHNTQILYNNVILIPQKFTQGKHNRVVYKIAVFNDNGENIERDLAILPKKLAGLPLKGNGTLDLMFVKTENNEIIDGHKIIGNIEIVNNTYYDFASKQTIQGLASGSQRGYIIPFNFKGDMTYVMTVDINADFENLKLMYNQNIDKPYLDRFEGIIKLKMIKNIKPKSKLQYHLLKNKDFGKISQNNLSLEAILLLSKKEEDEENMI